LLQPIDHNRRQRWEATQQDHDHHHRRGVGPGFIVEGRLLPEVCGREEAGQSSLISSTRNPTLISGTRYPIARIASSKPRRPAMPKLTPRQQRFIAEYVKDLNGTQAAIRAGYSERSAASRRTSCFRKLQFRNLLRIFCYDRYRSAETGN
jgi:hypothetical protein